MDALNITGEIDKMEGSTEALDGNFSTPAEILNIINTKIDAFSTGVNTAFTASTFGIDQTTVLYIKILFLSSRLCV